MAENMNVSTLLLCFLVINSVKATVKRKIYFFDVCFPLKITDKFL